MITIASYVLIRLTRELRVFPESIDRNPCEQLCLP